jgi:putative sterol carrier protein
MATTEEIRARGAGDARFVSSLKGLTGHLCLSVKGETKLVLEVSDGTARIVGVDAGPADATLHCNDLESLARVIRGETNAVVAALQGYMYLTGDREFGARVMLGLNAESPYRGERLGELG